jgi:AraC-like DNA-binding protein
MRNREGVRFHKLAIGTDHGMLEQRLFFWRARGLYLGHALGLRPHRNAVAVLCVSLDAPSRLARDPLRASSGHVEFRTALIPPNTLHHLCSPDGNRMAFLYVDALSQDYVQLLAAMLLRDPRFGIGHAAEQALIETLLALAQGAPWKEVRDRMIALLGLADARDPDQRIADTLLRLHASPGDDHSLEMTAHSAQLSASHFLHLFKAETGVPFRRYRLWIRMGAALKAVREGHSLTDAAHAAGFASSAHFSTSFTEMFGLPPSRLARARSIAPVSREVRAERAPA